MGLIPERGSYVVTVIHRVDQAAEGPWVQLASMVPADILARHEASTIEPYVLIHEMEIVRTL